METNGVFIVMSILVLSTLAGILALFSWGRKRLGDDAPDTYHNHTGDGPR